jgi:hypothetical protein
VCKAHELSLLYSDLPQPAPLILRISTFSTIFSFVGKCTNDATVESVSGDTTASRFGNQLTEEMVNGDTN